MTYGRPEDYSAWRREHIEEVAELARYLDYSDLAGWGKEKDLRALAAGTRTFNPTTRLTGRIGQTLHAIWSWLAHRRPFLSQR